MGGTVGHGGVHRQKAGACVVGAVGRDANCDVGDVGRQDTSCEVACACEMTSTGWQAVQLGCLPAGRSAGQATCLATQPQPSLANSTIHPPTLHPPIGQQVRVLGHHHVHRAVERQVGLPKEDGRAGQTWEQGQHRQC